MRWGVVGLILFYMVGEGCIAIQAPASNSIGDQDSFSPTRVHKKKHKSKKHKSKKSQKKQKLYSPKKIEKILKNDDKDGVCNRLNCSSNLKIAKSCLQTKSDHRKNKDCFHAFCAYGCNEEDYATKTDVFNFCNRPLSKLEF